MQDHFFISYSSVDGLAFTLKLADKLSAGPPSFPVWLDKREIRPGEDWDEQIVEAIRTCKGMLFVMTRDSVEDLSGCKDEWVRALKYKKPIIPLQVDRDAELPFRLGSREYIKFTDTFDTLLARLRNHLTWIATPEGQLQALKYRLADAQRDLKRAEPDQQLRIQEDISDLRRQIEQQQANIANPDAAEKRVQQSIDQGLERARKPEKPVSESSYSKFINPPPLIAPTWFQNRYVEIKLIGEFLKDDALRVMTIVGRGGVGKTAMVCRLLRSLEGGQLPYEGGELTLSGIIYLSDGRSFHRVNVEDLYTGLSKLLPAEVRDRIAALYKNPKTNTQELMQALTDVFSRGRTVILLDNFEDEVNVETGNIKSVELKESLVALLELPPHGLKVIITTRVAPSDLIAIHPSLQRRINLDTGLDHPYAENVLEAMDADGKIGLKNAPAALLTKARERTMGYPRALEHLFGILSADRNTSLQEILSNTEKLLPEQVVTVLVGEAFSRLDLTAQKVMQALAIYRYPVLPTAIDYLLQPFVPGIDSGQVLGRLVNMQFVHRDAGRYYLHQIDRDYSLHRIQEGVPTDRDEDLLPFSQFALQYRAADWFRLARKPREEWNTLQDLSSQLSEFELRCACEDYDTAAYLLIEISHWYLFLWGHYKLVIDLHERIKGKITDSRLKISSQIDLGNSFHRMEHYIQAINSFEQALGLAKEQGDKSDEGILLGNLGNCYSDMGEVERSNDYYMQALDIAREIGNRNSEAVNLHNIGDQYFVLGQTLKAIEYFKQALTIQKKEGNKMAEAHGLESLGNSYIKLGKHDEAMLYLQNALSLTQRIGYRFIETATQTDIGYLYLDQSQWYQANKHFHKAIEIADEITSPGYQKLARIGLAYTKLYQDMLEEAKEISEEAQKFDLLIYSPENWTLLGVIALLKKEYILAKEAFTSSLQQVEQLLALSPQLNIAGYYQGLALCGLALCGITNHISTAKEAFKTAHAINIDSGNVQRVLKLLDCLSKADTMGILVEVRPYAAGGNAGYQ